MRTPPRRNAGGQQHAPIGAVPFTNLGRDTVDLGRGHPQGQVDVQIVEVGRRPRPHGRADPDQLACIGVPTHPDVVGEGGRSGGAAVRKVGIPSALADALRRGPQRHMDADQPRNEGDGKEPHEQLLTRAT